MECPFCLHKKTDIYNTRGTHGSTTVWRRRRCLACNKAFTTQEHIDFQGVWKVAGPQKTTPYSRAKLTVSLLRACDHRGKQDDEVWYLCGIIEQKLAPLAAQNSHIIPRAELIDTAALVLKRFDAAAYVKYLSYHQLIPDVKALRKRLRRG